MYPYIGGIIRGEKGRLLKINGTANHIHILTVFAPVIAVSDMIRRIKGNSSKWINEERGLQSSFAWQRGYGAFSVSESTVEKVSEYIENQGEHHGKMSFQEEFLLLLRKHNVAYDEKYLWD